jgi:hypothetical protein
LPLPPKQRRSQTAEPEPDERHHGEGGGLLGADLATAYLTYAKPWLDWNRAEAQLRVGHRVWFDYPPPSHQADSVIGPYLVAGVAIAGTGMWIACLLDLPGTDPVTLTLALAVAVIIKKHHRVRAAILSIR